jgi:hypothetical protein
MLINDGLKTLHFEYNIFSFYDSRYINKDQILLHFVLNNFLMNNNLLNLDANVYIYLSI